MMNNIGHQIKKIIPRRRIKTFFAKKRSKNLTGTFIISFPKCGRTWLRLMLGRAFVNYFKLPCTSIDDFLELEKFWKQYPQIPRVKIKHDDDPFWKKADELEASKKQYKNAKIIFLVRDPRDVLISSYFEKTKRQFVYEGKIYEGKLNEYIYEQVGGFDTIIRYYNIWEKNRCIPKSFLIVRYEDIHANPQKELRRVLDFLDCQEISSEIINESVQFAAFDNMHKIEKEGKINSYRLQPGNRDDDESYKTRQGKVGGFHEYLEDNEIRYLNQKMKKKLSDIYRYIV